MKRASILLALFMAWSTVAPAAQRGDALFVVTYRCHGDHWLAVGYPAFRDARAAPIRITWEGRTVLLHPARAGSGARYVNALASLEWWSKGAGGTLTRLSPHRPRLTGCVEA